MEVHLAAEGQHALAHDVFARLDELQATRAGELQASGGEDDKGEILKIFLRFLKIP